MASYNLTELQAATDLGKVFAYANHVTSNIFSALVVFAIFFILLMKLKVYGFPEAFASSSFICFLICLTLFYGNILNIIFVLLFLAMLVISVFWLYMQN